MFILTTVIFWPVFAGNLEPPGPPTSGTMKTLDEIEPRIPIHAADIPFTISAPNSYYLAETVWMTDSNANAITINCANVTIDLMGHSLIGTGAGTGCGVYKNSCRNIEIRNGTIRDFGGCGIKDANSNSSKDRVINMRILANKETGIYLFGTCHTIMNCTVGDNHGHGIFVNAWCSIIDNAVCFNHNSGIRGSIGNMVRGNTTGQNGYHGIEIYDSLVCHNAAHGNNTSGGEYQNIYAPGSTVVDNFAP